MRDFFDVPVTSRAAQAELERQLARRRASVTEEGAAHPDAEPTEGADSVSCPGDEPEGPTLDS